MKKILLLTVALILSSALLQAAVKAPVKKPASPTNKAKLGTTQLKGDQAQIGTTYTIGAKNPVNFTLKNVEYRVDQVQIDGEVFVTKAEEKLIVLHYTLHNPQKRDLTVRWNLLKFTAVDANDKNWAYCGNIGKAGTTDKLYMGLKPAQKTNAFTVVKVPAKGEIPKLIVESGDHLVLRYDLRGKVKPLPAPIADPSDESGATALEQVPAQKGEYYPVGHLDVKLDKCEFKEGPMGKYSAAKGNRILVTTLTAKNKTSRKFSLRWSTIKPKLVDVDGMDVKWLDVVRASRDENLPPVDVEPGQEITFRWLFDVPTDLPLKALSMKGTSDGRAYIYDMSDVK